ncbi:MAG TPA: hypothetical protein VMW66_01165 [Elusimicrobiales bacterium]|nr:hypothetical protein [Elusimicrobiales bacterium]
MLLHISIITGILFPQEISSDLDSKQKLVINICIFTFVPALMYTLIADITGTAILKISPEKILFSHKPLPIIPTKKIFVKEIREILKFPVKNTLGITCSYEIRVKMSGNKKYTIFYKLRKDEANLVIGKIDEYLKSNKIYIPNNLHHPLG